MRIVACFAVVALALPSQAQAQAQEASPLAAAQQLLDRRTAAVATGDRDAFLATIDPQAPAAFKERQARSFDGLRSVPITAYRLTARLDDTGDLAPEPDRFLPATRATYRLEGYDDRDAVDYLWLTFVQRDGQWFVAADDDVAAVGLDSARNLWDDGPVRILRTEHFLVLSHPDKAKRADELAAMAEEAHTAFRRVWTHPWSGRIPMIVPTSTDQLEEMLQSTIDLDKFVAFVSYGFVRDTGFEATAPRLFVQDATFSRNSRRYQVQTLVHELVHAAAAPSTGPFQPVWLQEGLAEWLATGRPSVSSAPKGGDGTAPRSYEFSTGSQHAIVRSYAEARTLTAALARSHSPVDLFRSLGEARVAPGDEDHHVDAAMRRLFGIGTADLEAQWRGS